MFGKLFSKKEEEKPQQCGCEEEDIDPIVRLYHEMYCLAATITDSEIEEGDVLAKDRSSEIDHHMKRMMFLFSEVNEEAAI